MFIHDWDFAAHADNSANMWDNNYILTNFGNYHYGAMHHYSVLWVPEGKNGGTGLIRRYVDFRQMGPDLTYSSIGTTNPALSPDNAVGALSQMEGENFCMALSNVVTVPLNIGRIEVWQ
jgi:hypothetical protein